jgi:large subunit ribosomal protein L23Ae
MAPKSAKPKAAAKPQGKSSKPQAKTAKPQAKASKPQAKTSKPKAKTSKPKAKSAKPQPKGSKGNVHSQKKVKPAAKSAKSAAKKVTPKQGKQPSKAATKPTKKGSKPKHPALRKGPVAIVGKKADKSGRQGSTPAKRLTVRRKHIWTTVQFHRPYTQRLPGVRKYARQCGRTATRVFKHDSFRVIKYPLTTESAMKKIEDHNTLVFIVDLKANKNNIKQAVRKMYDIKASKVNTLIRPDGLKKAYVKLRPEYDALDVANKIGIL